MRSLHPMGMNFYAPQLCPHGIDTSQQQCMSCTKEQQQAELDRLRAERDALDTQVCELISQVENTIYKLGGDSEAIRQAKGCVEYAREVRRRCGHGS